MSSELPDYHDSNFAAVCLMQRGVVYADESPSWDLTLNYRTKLEDLFATFGLKLVVAEDDGYAYIRQLDENEQEEGYENLPRIMRKVPMNYEQTLVCILLRDELRRFEEEELHSTKCVVSHENLFSAYLGFHASVGDEKRLKTKFDTAVKRICDHGFAKKLKHDPPAYHVKPILKARFNHDQLEEVREKLRVHLHGEEEDS